MGLTLSIDLAKRREERRKDAQLERQRNILDDLMGDYESFSEQNPPGVVATGLDGTQTFRNQPVPTGEDYWSGKYGTPNTPEANQLLALDMMGNIDTVDMGRTMMQAFTTQQMGNQAAMDQIERRRELEQTTMSMSERLQLAETTRKNREDRQKREYELMSSGLGEVQEAAASDIRFKRGIYGTLERRMAEIREAAGLSPDFGLSDWVDYKDPVLDQTMAAAVQQIFDDIGATSEEGAKMIGANQGNVREVMINLMNVAEGTANFGETRRKQVAKLIESRAAQADENIDYWWTVQQEMLNQTTGTQLPPMTEVIKDPRAYQNYLYGTGE